MKNYFKYSIEQRKYSSNINLGHFKYIDNKNKEHEKTDIVLLSGLNKQEGDILIENTYNLIKDGKVK
jgi:hypothetical protein